MSDDFIAKVNRQLRDLQRLDSDLQAQELGVQRKRAELLDRITKLEATIEVYKDVMEVASDAAPQVGLFDTASSNGSGSIAELATAAIIREGGTAKVRDISDSLVEIGKIKAGPSAYRTVYSILQRDPRFVRVERGTFGLAN